MNTLYMLHAVTPDLRVRVVRDMPELAADLSAAVDAVWHEEQQRLEGQLFNGRVFSADHITPSLITGHWTEYRRVVAQMRRPELHQALCVRSFAVGGVITSPDGVVFGRRPGRSVYQAGQWQLAPAGSVDPGCARADGWVDVVAMLLVELSEELGLTQADVSDATPVALVEHAGSHVLDLGIALRTHLSASDILAIHTASGNGEYDPLVVVPHAELATFLAQPNMTLQAPIFLGAHRPGSAHFGA